MSDFLNDALDGIGTVVSELESFQTWVGAADAEEALEHIARMVAAEAFWEVDGDGLLASPFVVTDVVKPKLVMAANDPAFVVLPTFQLTFFRAVGASETEVEAFAAFLEEVGPILDELVRTQSAPYHWRTLDWEDRPHLGDKAETAERGPFLWWTVTIEVGI